MAVKMAAVCVSQDAADALSKKLVVSGVPSRDISVMAQDMKTEDEKNYIDADEELKSDGQTLGGQTGYLVSAGLALFQGSGGFGAAGATPSMTNTNVGAGITADFVDLGVMRQDFAWMRSKLESGYYLVYVKAGEDAAETANMVLREGSEEIRIFS